MIFIMYDISSRASFLNCRDWVDKAREEGGDDVILILVGNKSDIPDTEREVSSAEGESLANELGMLFIETSAKSGNNVKASFILAASKLPLPEDNIQENEEVLNIKLDKMQLEVRADSKARCSC